MEQDETGRDTEKRFHDIPMPLRLRDYIAIVRKRKWLVLGLFVAAVLGSAWYMSTQTAVYDSTVSLMIEPTGPNVMSKAVEEVYAPSDITMDYYKTQYEIIKSYNILRDTVARLNLKQHPEYMAQAARPPGPVESWFAETKSHVLSWFKSLLPLNPVLSEDSPAKGDSAAESETERQLVNAFGGHVLVKPLLNSRIVRITVESTDPQLAASAANTMASVYINRSLEMKMGASQEASKWIAEHVEELRKKLETSESALQEFTRRYGLINVDEHKRLVTQKLGDLNAQLVQAETKRVEAEARFKQIGSIVNHPNAMESSAEVLSSALIQSLRGEEIKASQKIAEMSERYGPKYPAMVQAVSELNELQARIRGEIRKIYSAVKGEYDVAVARERVVRTALDQQKNDVMATGEHEVQYGILAREVQSNRQLYEMFLKRMKETDIATDMRTSNIFVVDAALASTMPVRPNKKQAVLLAGLFGLLFGIAVAFFLDHLDSTIKTPDDIARYLAGTSFLGFLPKFKATKYSRDVELAMDSAPHSLFAENLRSIRTSLFLSANKPPQTMLVTSPQEEEGKTTLAANLAIAIGQLGYPTVLIDGDLRRPRLHNLFNLDVKKGLSQYLAGEAEIHEILLDTPMPKLRIVPCGPIPDNPCELLQSKPMQALLAGLKKEGSYVIVDSSPILAVSDPLVIGNRVDAVILVVWAGHSPRNAARLSVKLMSEAKVKKCGIVLQRLLRPEMSGAFYRYYQRQYYASNPGIGD